MRAYVNTVNHEIGMPIVKNRLKPWQLSMVPMLKIIFSQKWRNRLFSKGGPYNATAADLGRRLNHYFLLVGVTALFAYLTYNAVRLFKFLAIPNFVMVPYGVPIAVMVLLVSTLVNVILKKAMRTRFAALAQKAADKDTFKKRTNSFNRRYQFIHAIQAIAFIVAVAFPWSIFGLSTLTIVHPVIQIALYVIVSLIFFETWKLTLYATNSLFMGMATWSFNFTHNIYEVSNKRDHKKIIDRLYRMFTDNAPANGQLHQTRGQERIDSFLNALEEMTNNDEYKFNLDLNLGEEIHRNLSRLMIPLFNSGHLNQAAAQELRENITRFVHALGQRKVFIEDGVTYKAKKTEYLGLMRVMEFINGHYRLDKGGEPKTWKEALPMTRVTHGATEDYYYDAKGLLGNDMNSEKQEFTHRLGMLARDKTESFLLMVERLTAPGSQQRKELLRMISHPNHPNRPDDRVGEDRWRTWTAWPQWEEIEMWANMNLPTVYANTVSNSKTSYRHYAYYAKQFRVAENNPAERQREVYSKFRIIDRHLNGMSALDIALGGRTEARGPDGRVIPAQMGHLRGIADAFIATDYTGDTNHVTVHTGETIDVNGMLAAHASLPRAISSQRVLSKTYEVISKYRAYPGMVLNRTISTDWEYQENYHRSKWNQKASVLPFLIGPVLLNQDADQQSNYIDEEFMTSHLLEYFYLPGLAVSIPVMKHTLTKGLGLLGNIIPVSENAFYYHSQQGKMLFGGLMAYGKLFERVSALRWSEGLTDSYVAEDAVTALSYRRFGYIVGRAGYIRLGKGWPFQFQDARNPTRKWAYDNVESMTGAIPQRVLSSPYVDWPYRINNFWLDGFGFYSKKPSIIRYVKWLDPFYLILNINLFSGIAGALWVGSVMLSQSISYGLFFYNIYDEGNGVIRGTLKSLWMIASGMYWYFVHMIFVYDETNRRLAPNRLGRFINTGGKSANLSRNLDWRYIYMRSAYAISSAAPWALAMLIFVGINPLQAFLWALIILMPFAGVMAPFVFNSVRPDHQWRDRLANVGHVFLALFWGYTDSMARWEYRIARFVPGARKSEDRIQQMIVEYGKLIPALEAENKEVFDQIALFQQYPGHYRGMYVRVALPAISKALDIIADRFNSFEIDEQTGVNTKIQAINQRVRAYAYASTPQLEDLRGTLSFGLSLREQLITTQAYVNNLSRVNYLQGTVRQANAGLRRVANILERRPSRRQLEKADWLLTQINYLPYKMTPIPTAKSKATDMVLNNVIGLDAIMQASTLAILPLLRLVKGRQETRAGPGHGFDHNMPFASSFRRLANDFNAKGETNIAHKLNVLAGALEILEAHPELPKGQPVAQRINNTPRWNLEPQRIREILKEQGQATSADFVIDQIVIHENQIGDREGIEAQLAHIRELILQEDEFNDVDSAERFWFDNARVRRMVERIETLLIISALGHPLRRSRRILRPVVLLAHPTEEQIDSVVSIRMGAGHVFEQNLEKLLVDLKDRGVKVTLATMPRRAEILRVHPFADLITRVGGRVGIGVITGNDFIETKQRPSMTNFPTIAGREQALRQAQSVYRGPTLQGSVVLLLDDVITTGTSLKVASEILADAGASLVVPIGVIRAPFGSPVWEKGQVKRVIHKYYLDDLETVQQWTGATSALKAIVEEVEMEERLMNGIRERGIRKGELASIAALLFKGSGFIWRNQAEGQPVLPESIGLSQFIQDLNRVQREAENSLLFHTRSRNERGEISPFAPGDILINLLSLIQAPEAMQLPFMELVIAQVKDIVENKVKPSQDIYERLRWTLVAVGIVGNLVEYLQEQIDKDAHNLIPGSQFIAAWRHFREGQYRVAYDFLRIGFITFRIASSFWVRDLFSSHITSISPFTYPIADSKPTADGTPNYHVNHRYLPQWVQDQVAIHERERTEKDAIAAQAKVLGEMHGLRLATPIGASQSHQWTDKWDAPYFGYDGEIFSIFETLKKENKAGSRIIELGGKNTPASAVMFRDARIINFDLGAPAAIIQQDNVLAINADVQRLGNLSREQITASANFWGMPADTNISDIFQAADTVIISNLLNYVNFRLVLNFLADHLRPGARIVIQNGYEYGHKPMYDNEHGVKSDEELLRGIDQNRFAIEGLYGEHPPLIPEEGWLHTLSFEEALQFKMGILYLLLRKREIQNPTPTARHEITRGNSARSQFVLDGVSTAAVAKISPIIPVLGTSWQGATPLWGEVFSSGLGWMIIVTAVLALLSWISKTKFYRRSLQNNLPVLLTSMVIIPVHLLFKGVSMAVKLIAQALTPRNFKILLIAASTGTGIWAASVTHAMDLPSMHQLLDTVTPEPSPLAKLVVSAFLILGMIIWIPVIIIMKIVQILTRALRTWTQGYQTFVLLTRFVSGLRMAAVFIGHLPSNYRKYEMTLSAKILNASTDVDSDKEKESQAQAYQLARPFYYLSSKGILRAARYIMTWVTGLFSYLWMETHFTSKLIDGSKPVPINFFEKNVLILGLGINAMLWGLPLIAATFIAAWNFMTWSPLQKDSKNRLVLWAKLIILALLAAIFAMLGMTAFANASTLGGDVLAHSFHIGGPSMALAALASIAPAMNEGLPGPREALSNHRRSSDQQTETTIAQKHPEKKEKSTKEFAAASVLFVLAVLLLGMLFILIRNPFGRATLQVFSSASQKIFFTSAVSIILPWIIILTPAITVPEESFQVLTLRPLARFIKGWERRVHYERYADYPVKEGLKLFLDKRGSPIISVLYDSFLFFFIYIWNSLHGKWFSIVTVYVEIIKIVIRLSGRQVVLYLVNLLSLNQKNCRGLSGVVDRVTLTIFTFDIEYTSIILVYSMLI